MFLAERPGRLQALWLIGDREVMMEEVVEWRRLLQMDATQQHRKERG